MKINKPKIMRKLEYGIINDFNGEEKIYDKELNDIELKGLNKSYLEVDGCIFKNINFTDFICNKEEIIDVIFNNCIFSNVDFSNAIIHRVEFNNCQLVGTDFGNSSFKDVVFSDCNAKYINFSFSKFSNVIFKDINLLEGYFGEMILKNTIYNNCILTGCDFLNTKLKDIDLSSSNISKIRITLEDLKGAIVGIHQTEFITRMMGLKIKE